MTPGLIVNAFYRRWPHHATHSGYPRFLDHLPDQVRVRRVTRERAPHVPVAIHRSMVQGAGSEHYTLRSAGFELSAARRMWGGHAEICHLLYGESDFRHLARLAPRRRGAVVCTLHLPPDLFHELMPDPRLLDGADAVIVICGEQAELLRDLLGEDRVCELRLGVDCEFFSPPPIPGPLHAGRAVFVGEHRRDFAMLEAVLRRLADLSPAAYVETVSSPARLAELSALPNVSAHRRRLRDEHLREVYRRAHLALMPLRDGTANNALLEAMACGIPVVATDVGGVRSYVDERCGVLVAPGDVEGMARAAAALMGDRERRTRLGRGARQRALELSLASVAERHVEVYRDALARRTALGAARSRPAARGALT